jgi:hypothetical protein
MDTFLTYPEFINLDPRKNRTKGYIPTLEFQTLRHTAMLPSDLFKGKNVLDLGCCIAATGAWVLDHGAASYIGVELNKDFYDIAISLMETYFANHEWFLFNTDILEFLIKNETTYDVVIASGIIYSVTDTWDFLRKITQIGDTILIESDHPIGLMYMLLDKLPTKFKEKIDVMSVLETVPFVLLQQTNMIKDIDGNHHENLQGALPSIQSLVMMMQEYDYHASFDSYQKLKEKIPEVYGKKRYAVCFSRMIDR